MAIFDSKSNYKLEPTHPKNTFLMGDHQSQIMHTFEVYTISLVLKRLITLCISILTSVKYITLSGSALHRASGIRSGKMLKARTTLPRSITKK